MNGAVILHEMSLATSLMEQIESIAKTHDLHTIREIEIETGVLRQVIPEVMQTAFKEVAAGTLAEQTILKIIEVEARVRCDLCQLVFHPEINDFLCPACRKAKVTVIQGDDIILKSLVGDSEEENRRE